MKDNKQRLVLGGLSLIICCMVFLLMSGEVRAQDCQIVRIYGQAFPEQTMWIEPKVLVITKESCVVWFNAARSSKVKVNFRDGKKCADTTEAASGFRLNNAQCYVTDYIPLGGTSSLKFKDAGTFNYEIELEGVAKKVEGQIVVK